ncbi:BRISC complex subunit Abraxas 2 [Lethenteron reissneri]|uniref:BRISC complex subunit Abraxas 2 n=1 Tax=Lethenteron reissneri TaxID=7753 RepID=UPI002AB6B9FA|nr:BRISC complex subunit Abraxas 2 [Lethenteron reissneri]
MRTAPAVMAAAWASGPAVATLVLEQLGGSGDQEGFLLGGEREERVVIISDTHLNNTEQRTHIEIHGHLPCLRPSSFYDGVGKVDKATVENLLREHSKSLLGWYRFRRNTSQQLTFRETQVHRNLCQVLGKPDLVFLLFGFLSTANHSTHALEYVMFQPSRRSQPRVPLTIRNLGNLAQQDYLLSAVPNTSRHFTELAAEHSGEFLDGEGVVRDVRRIFQMYSATQERLQLVCGEVAASERALESALSEVELLQRLVRNKEEERDRKRREEERIREEERVREEQRILEEKRILEEQRIREEMVWEEERVREEMVRKEARIREEERVLKEQRLREKEERVREEKRLQEQEQERVREERVQEEKRRREEERVAEDEERVQVEAAPSPDGAPAAPRPPLPPAAAAPPLVAPGKETPGRATRGPGGSRGVAAATAGAAGAPTSADRRSPDPAGEAGQPPPQGLLGGSEAAESLRIHAAAGGTAATAAATALLLRRAPVGTGESSGDSAGGSSASSSGASSGDSETEGSEAEGDPRSRDSAKDA